MILTDEQKRIITQVINVFETGTPAGKYDAISIFGDGPGGRRQITYGRSQTTEYGNLAELVRRYIAIGGLFAAQLGTYLDAIGRTPFVDDERFKHLLRVAGKTDKRMRDAQDAFFDDVYFKPAMEWSRANGFVEALSALVIYDSFIHSGGVLNLLRRRFPEVPPVKGGDERAWVGAYVETRHHWLSTHSRVILRGTVYRTKCFQEQIRKGNWNLSQLPIRANGVNVK